MSKVRTFLGLVVFLLVFSAAYAAQAGKPNDSKTPAEETVCDGLEGSAFGLCNAYCEAKDCDPYNSTNSCDQLLGNYQNQTGYPGPPCACGQVCEIEREACVGTCKDDCADFCEYPDCQALCADVEGTIARIICERGCQRDCPTTCEVLCRADNCAGPFIECGLSCLHQSAEQFCNLHPDICDHGDDD